MEKICNLIANKEFLKDWCSTEKLNAFCTDCGLDGFEVICAGDFATEIPQDKIKGLHLPFYNSWMDLYLGDTAALDAEYGGREIWQQFYGGSNFSGVYSLLEEQLQFAHSLGVKYVVLHVCEIGTTETLTGRFKYTDTQVIDAMCAIVNRLFKNKPYTFDLLLENLWWRGFTFTDSALTQRMLNGIEYKNKGIMLDTGHLMHTNKSLRSWQAAADYIVKMADNHRDILPFVKGVHLHGTLEGEFAQNFYAQGVDIKEEYYQRFAQAYDYVLRVDAHRVFAHSSVKEVVNTLKPDYLVYEFAADTMEEKKEMNLLQNSFFK